MTDSALHPPAQLTPEDAEVLAAKLVAEMIERWRQGERPLPEEYLARHPGLWKHPEAAADLIYEELCLRQEYGPPVTVELLLRRFPQWRPQIEVLFDCQRVLGPCSAPPAFPSAGETVGGFLLLAELGRGAHGRVFLASQRVLGDRPVVVKLTPADANEHLSLARLQHTHIVPLYSVEDDPERGLRALCMPYFGGATLAHILDALRTVPPPRRSGQDLVDVLDRLQAEVPLVAPARGTARQTLGRAGYVQALCWIGACLADALHYAHERGLVHLDLKPSNVLLAADGQPMVLDFHLAHEPIQPGDESATWLGGTSGYMSPEQEAALRAIQRGRTAERPVDGRSDIYSLGVVLYEALGGRSGWHALRYSEGRGVASRPSEYLTACHPSLRRANPQISVGLEDVIRKCLAENPDDRYPSMAALAADLRRHLADLPLAGVRNRSLRERWRKWRRRRPHGVALAGMMLAVLTAAGAVALGAMSYLNQRIELARGALKEGQAQKDHAQWDSAVRTLRAGLDVARGTPWQGALADELAQQLHEAEQRKSTSDRAALAAELHQLAGHIRFLYGAPYYAPEGGSLRGLEARCRTFWEKRDQITQRLSAAGNAGLAPAVRDDLLDLAIFWADLGVRLASPAGKEQAQQNALQVLAQAETLCGPSVVLDEERKHYGLSEGRGTSDEGRGTSDEHDGLAAHPSHLAPRPSSLVPRPSPLKPRTPWEHFALGRSLLRSGDLDGAAKEMAEAVRMEPQSLWPNFYRGWCAYRQGKYADAVTAYSVCIGASPEAACFFNRGLAYEALGRPDLAMQDYDQAVHLDETLSAALQNRDMLPYHARR
jgi:eukaryotic-like serine/threonine-protein kinase